MDKFDMARLFLMLSMIAALIMTSHSTPEDKAAAEQCLMFPQFVAAASSSKEDKQNAEKLKITYAFGIGELLQRLF